MKTAWNLTYVQRHARGGAAQSRWIKTTTTRLQTASGVPGWSCDTEGTLYVFRPYPDLQHGPFDDDPVAGQAVLDYLRAHGHTTGLFAAGYRHLSAVLELPLAKVVAVGAHLIKTHQAAFNIDRHGQPVTIYLPPLRRSGGGRR